MSLDISVSVVLRWKNINKFYTHDKFYFIICYMEITICMYISINIVSYQGGHSVGSSWRPPSWRSGGDWWSSWAPLHRTGRHRPPAASGPSPGRPTPPSGPPYLCWRPWTRRRTRRRRSSVRVWGLRGISRCEVSCVSRLWQTGRCSPLSRSLPQTGGGSVRLLGPPHHQGRPPRHWGYNKLSTGYLIVIFTYHNWMMIYCIMP